jgi:hypothetical protein
MLLPCEVAVKSLVPSLRSTIAKELIQTYGLKQKDVANLLGITQTAVSKYIRHVRGTVIEIGSIEEVRPMIDEIVVLLANGGLSRDELLGKLCRICEIVRRKRLMCELCKRADPSMDIHKCFACLR